MHLDIIFIRDNKKMFKHGTIKGAMWAPAYYFDCCINSKDDIRDPHNYVTIKEYFRTAFAGHSEVNRDRVIKNIMGLTGAKQMWINVKGSNSYAGSS